MTAGVATKGTASLGQSAGRNVLQREQLARSGGGQYLRPADLEKRLCYLEKYYDQVEAMLAGQIEKGPVKKLPNGYTKKTKAISRLSAEQADKILADAGIENKQFAKAG